MKADLTKLLNDWKNEEEFHKLAKLVTVRKSPIKAGEYYIVFSKKANVKFLNSSKEIEVKRTLHTSAQSNDPISDNPNSDNYKTVQLLKAVDSEFIDLFLKAENELVQMEMPDGFF